MITIYHNSRCRKSREALELVKQSGEPFEIREYLKKSPTVEELTQVLKQLDLNAQGLLRKGESVYKEKFKGKEYSDEQWIQIMVKYPILIERPIVIKDGTAVVGRPVGKVEDLLKA